METEVPVSHSDNEPEKKTDPLKDFTQDFTKLLTTEGPKLFGDFISKLGMDEKFVKEATDVFREATNVCNSFSTEEKSKKSEETEESKETEDEKDSIVSSSDCDHPTCTVLSMMESLSPEERSQVLDQLKENFKPRFDISRLTVNYSQRMNDDSYRVRLTFDMPSLEKVHGLVEYLTL